MCPAAALRLDHDLHGGPKENLFLFGNMLEIFYFICLLRRVSQWGDLCTENSVFVGRVFFALLYHGKGRLQSRILSRAIYGKT